VDIVVLCLAIERGFAIVAVIAYVLLIYCANILMKQSTGLFAIIRRSFMWLIIAALLVVGALTVFALNFRPSIEFTGGVEMGLIWTQHSDTLQSDIVASLTEQWFSDIQVNIEEKEEQTSLLVSLPFQDDTQVKQVSDSLKYLLITKQHISSESDIIGLSLNGPSVSSYMKSTTISALIVSLIFIAVYMMFSFAGMRKHISPLTLAVVVIVTMIFDVAMPAGAYGLWMMLNHTVTVNTVFIIALLTTMWYSINDTIIILDRIRENTIKQKESLEKWTTTYLELFESSLWQTMRRSIGTSLSTFLAVAAMFVFGESVMQSFALAMGIGVLAGSFSSIFVAAPLAYILLGKRQKEFKKS